MSCNECGSEAKMLCGSCRKSHFHIVTGDNGIFIRCVTCGWELPLSVFFEGE